MAGDVGGVAVAQAHSLQRAARLVEAHAQRVRGSATRLADARHLAEAAEQLAADLARERGGVERGCRAGLPGVDHGAHQAGSDRDEVRHAAALEYPLDGCGREARVERAEGEHREALADAEGPQARLEILGVEVAGERLGEHVADHVALQHLVAFVDELAEGALGDRDEGQRVGNLEQREVASARGRDERARQLACARSPCRSRDRRCRDRRADRRTLAAAWAPAAAALC